MVSFLKKVCLDIEHYQLTVEGIALMDSQGTVLFHKRWQPDYPRDIYSNTKSFVSAAAGMAVFQGRLTLNDKLVDIVKCNSIGRGDYLAEITLGDLLSMSSGYGKPLLMYFDRRNGIGAENYLEYMLGEKVIEKPGNRFVYSSGDSILAGIMVENAVGCSLAKFLYDSLFSQIGIGFPVWECDLSNHFCGASGLQLRLLDMMQLGVLYLNNGSLNGNRLFDNSWVTCSTKPIFELPQKDLWSDSYGLCWKTSTTSGIYRASGVFGQETIVVPHRGVVIGIQCAEETNFAEVQRIVDEGLLSKMR